MESSVSLNFSSLAQGHINKLKDAFQMIDDDGDGVISQKDLDKIFRSFGKQLSDSELEGMIKGQNIEDSDGVTFPEFLSMMSNTLCELPEENEIINCLKTLSGGDELQIPTAELISQLKEAGFQNPEKEFARLLKDFSSNNQITNEKVFKGKQFLNTFTE